MTRRADTPHTRADILQASGVLAIVRTPPAPPAPAPGQPPVVGANPAEGDEVLLALWDAFKEHGIEIPYPRRDVRILKDSESLAEKEPPQLS